jgi:hypothetical protein
MGSDGVGLVSEGTGLGYMIFLRFGPVLVGIGDGSDLSSLGAVVEITMAVVTGSIGVGLWVVKGVSPGRSADNPTD